MSLEFAFIIFGIHCTIIGILIGWLIKNPLKKIKLEDEVPK